MLSKREMLPIFASKEAILAAIRTHPAVILIGETGSGKTTQIPQFLLEAGYGESGMIAVTQPRRVAAMQLATRVAAEVGGGAVGGKVGFSVRFNEATSRETRVKFMTDGMLQRELLVDSSLRRYSVVVVDEAHERTVATDILLGVLRTLQSGDTRRKRPLKVVVMSATLNATSFAEFLRAPIYYVPGRQHPVRTLYAAQPVRDYLDAAVTTILQLHVEKPVRKNANHILCFLTGEDEIHSVARILAGVEPTLPKTVPKYLVCPFFAAQSDKQHSLVFEDPGHNVRKIILATNIAETSLTIPGVTYVVDTGRTKVTNYLPRSGLSSLEVVNCSKCQARQRAGRAGREGPGECYRLWTEESWHDGGEPSNTPGAGSPRWVEELEPEIRRTELSNVLLQLKAIGVRDATQFPWLDPVGNDAIMAAEEALFALDATTGVLGPLSALGRRLVDYPLSPRFARLILDAHATRCTREMVTLVAALECDSLVVGSDRHAPARGEGADELGEASPDPLRWANTSFGDHVLSVDVVRQFVEANRVHETTLRPEDARAAREWCKARCVNFRSLQTCLSTISQLCQRMPPAQNGGSGGGAAQRVTFGGLASHVFGVNGAPDYAPMLQVLLAVFGDAAVAFRNREGRYEIRGGPGGAGVAAAALWNGSCLFRRPLWRGVKGQEAPGEEFPPKFARVGEAVLFGELVKSKDKVYIRGVSLIDPAWLGVRSIAAEKSSVTANANPASRAAGKPGVAQVLSASGSAFYKPQSAAKRPRSEDSQQQLSRNVFGNAVRQPTNRRNQMID